MSSNDHRDQHEVRKQKLSAWRDMGAAYPLVDSPTHCAGDLHQAYDQQYVT